VSNAVTEYLPQIIPTKLAVTALRRMFFAFTGQELNADKARELLEQTQQGKGASKK